MRPRAPVCLLVFASFLTDVVPAMAESPWDRPWEDANTPIVIDPYYANRIDWDKVVTDRRLKAMIHKATEGLTVDPLFLSRAREARSRGLLYGAYHLGRPGDPIRQAEAFLAVANQAGARFLAIDIEGDNPSRYMSLGDAQRFMEHVATRTGRYPAVYVSFSVYQVISARYDRSSTFAKG